MRLAGVTLVALLAASAGCETVIGVGDLVIVTTGGGGSAGAGGEAGAPVCEVTPGANPCLQCVQTKCCGPALRCTNNPGCRGCLDGGGAGAGGGPDGAACGDIPEYRDYLDCVLVGNAARNEGPCVAECTE